jgi:hypothetical protein
MEEGMAAPSGDTPRQKRALALARERLANALPTLVAARAGVAYLPETQERGVFEVPFLGRIYRIIYPSGDIADVETGQAPNHAASLILLHYLAQADGTPPAGEWIAFRELPDGMIYHSAFVGRVEPGLVGMFGNRPDALLASGRALGGMPLDLGDAAVSVDALPHIRLACIIHLGDDEFPPAANVLFDVAAGRHLPTEDLAVLGGLFVGALCKAAIRR